MTPEKTLSPRTTSPLAMILVAAIALPAHGATASPTVVSVALDRVEPAADHTSPATLVEPEDVAETPDPICGVCSIVIKPTSSSSSAAAEVRLPSDQAFAGDVELIVWLDDDVRVAGWIAGVEIAAGGQTRVAVEPGAGWTWSEVRYAWTRRHPTDAPDGTTPAPVVWDLDGSAAANPATIDARGAVELAFDAAFAGDVELIVVTRDDGRRAGTAAGLQLAAGTQLVVRVEAGEPVDWEQVDHAWLELRPTVAADGRFLTQADFTSEPHYVVPVRR